MSWSTDAPQRAAQLEDAARDYLDNATEDVHVQKAIAFALLAISARLEILEYIPR